MTPFQHGGVAVNNLSHKPCTLKIYFPVGLTADDGQNNLYENIPAREWDVLAFLDQYLKD